MCPKVTDSAAVRPTAQDTQSPPREPRSPGRRSDTLARRSAGVKRPDGPVKSNATPAWGPVVALDGSRTAPAAAQEAGRAHRVLAEALGELVRRVSQALTPREIGAEEGDLPLPRGPDPGHREADEAHRLDEPPPAEQCGRFLEDAQAILGGLAGMGARIGREVGEADLERDHAPG